MEKVFFNPVFIKIILNYACPLDVTERIKKYSINDAFHKTISLYENYSHIIPKNKKIIKYVPWLKEVIEKNIYKSIHARKNYMKALEKYKKAWLSLTLNIDLRKNRMTCSIYWSGNALCHKSISLRDKNKIDFRINNLRNRDIEVFCKHVYEIKENMYRDMLLICENF